MNKLNASEKTVSIGARMGLRRPRIGGAGRDLLRHATLAGATRIGR